MSRFALLVLTFGLLTIEVRCGEIGIVSKFERSLFPRAQGVLPHSTRLNLEHPPGNRVSVNTTRKIAQAGNTTTATRNPKLLPKFSIVAGLDIGGGLALPAVANLTPIARISQASTLPGPFRPYFAASYDPYPSPSSVHQSIQALYYLVERLSQQVDNFNKLSNNNSTEIFDVVDDRKRRKDKVKVKKSTAKKQKKKQQKIKDDEAEEIDDSEEKVPQKVVNAKAKKSSKSGMRQSTNAKQQAGPTNTTDNSMESNEMDSTNATMTNTTEQGNNTTQQPGYYYGGNPQNIDNVGLTYDTPQGTYGPPSDNYGPPSYNYGPPSTNYGTPSFAYGPPSYNYGPPSRGYGAPYESAHYTAFHEPLIYEDPSESSFGPQPSPQRWQQRLPFARSRSVGSTTGAPVVANGNGFVPIL